MVAKVLIFLLRGVFCDRDILKKVSSYCSVLALPCTEKLWTCLCMRYKTKLRKVKMRHVSKRNKYIKCPVPMSWDLSLSLGENGAGKMRTNEAAAVLLFGLPVTLRCELLGAVPVRGHVRCYCFPGTDVLDVSHVGNRKSLENSTRDYSGRCSYASP